MKFYNEIKMSPWRQIVAIGSMMLFLLLSACTDAGDRNNINDYDGDSYAYGDDLYYLNRDGKGFDGEIRQGQVTGTYFIYKGEWRAATVYEMDTYDYLVNEPWTIAKDADNRWGAVITDNCYVFENDKWREGNNSDCSLNLQGCTELRQDIVGLGSNGFWYKCDSLAWRFASNIEKDTVAWGEGKFDGEVRAGKIDKDYHYTYVSGDKAWREATDLEKNTYDYEKNKPWAAGKEGDAKWGEVNTVHCYVFEDSVWRAGTMYDCSLGLRGCTARRQDTVALGSLDSIKTWYKCDSLMWRTAKDIEIDTATWGAGKFDGEVRAGKVNKDVYYIYESGKRAWRVASTVEKDMYDYEKNKPWTAGKDGEIKKGAVTDTIYVFDATAWRVADNIEKVLGLCVSAIADSVGKVGSTYYICTPREWVFATELQYDTYKQNCTEFGQIIHGNVNKSYAYFCYGDKWKRFFGNESVSYGKLEDERDGQIYRTVKIGEQTWMAENLNYDMIDVYGNSADCQEKDPDCVKYGKLYRGYFCTEPLQGCPSGWHLPTKEEFEILIDAAGGELNAGKNLKSVSGWEDGGDGSDIYGFSALPADGFYSRGDEPSYEGLLAYFWSSSVGAWDYENKTGSYYVFGLSYDSNRMTSYDLHIGFSFSVRCVKDEEE